MRGKRTSPSGSTRGASGRPPPPAGTRYPRPSSGGDGLMLLMRDDERIHHARLDPGAKTLQEDLRSVCKSHAVLEKVTVEPREGNDLLGRYAQRGSGAFRNLLKHELGIVGHANRRRGITGRN